MMRSRVNGSWLQQLPADATLDDAIERLIFLAKIEIGLMELDAGGGIAHEEVEREFES